MEGWGFVTESRIQSGMYIFFQKILFSFAYFLLHVFADLKIEGTENAKHKRGGPLIIIANHKSFLDPLIVGLCFPFFSKVYPVRFIAKDTFFKNPIGWIFYKSMGAFPACKGQGLAASLKIPSRILREGGSVMFFPEGIRIREDFLGRPKIGAAELASQFPEVPILPIAISNTHKIGGHLGLLYKRSRLRVNIGEPFEYRDKAFQLPAESGIKILMGEIERSYQETPARRLQHPENPAPAIPL
jgi:1-acyl-sn-glycerol-3-phosphate acyltransferase